MVKSSVYYTLSWDETLGHHPGGAPKAPGQGRKTTRQEAGDGYASARPAGGVRCEFAGGKDTLLLPCDSRLIRIGCEQFKLSS